RSEKEVTFDPGGGLLYSPHNMSSSLNLAQRHSEDNSHLRRPDMGKFQPIKPGVPRRGSFGAGRMRTLHKRGAVKWICPDCKC
ncbi:hypothetical protein ABG768_019131, partial [Culter alburnus]